MTATDARPRPFGDILNRTFALYAEQFVPLFVIVAVFALPVALLEFYAQSGLAHLFDVLDQLLTLPPGPSLMRTRIMSELSRAAAPNGWDGVIAVCELIVYPFVRTALTIFAAQAVAGRAPAITAAYGSALPRWLPQVVVLFAFIGLAFVLAVAFVMASGIGILAVGAAGVFSRDAAVVAGIITTLLLSSAGVAAVAFGNLAWLMASVSIAIEDANPVLAIVRGLRRTFDRPFLRRTFAVALAILALDWFGAVAIDVAATAITSVIHAGIVAALAAALTRVVLDGVLGVFVLLYAQEIMLRREGSDLAAALLVAAPAEVPGDDGLDRSDHALIAHFLARRATLEPTVASGIAARIAERVRPKLRASFHYLNDADLLEHLGR